MSLLLRRLNLKVIEIAQRGFNYTFRVRYNDILFAERKRHIASNRRKLRGV